MRARFFRISELITAVGLQNVHEPQVKHLVDELWEIRCKGKDGISRAIYVTAHEKRIVVLRVFVKKTQKTPRKELKRLNMTKVNDLHQNWLKDPEYQTEYEALITAREASGFSQQEMAKRMNTKQSVVARLESAQGNPTIKTLNKYAEALGGHLEINIAR